MSEAPRKPGPGWFSRQQCAEFLGVSVAQFDKHYRRIVGKSAEKTTKAGNVRALWIKGRAVVDALISHEIEKAMRSAPKASTGAEVGVGADERLKAAKASMAENELRKQQGELLEAAEVRKTLARLATILRGLGVILGRNYGPEAQKMLDEALADFEREVCHGGLGE